MNITEVVILEDNQEYGIVDTIEINNTKYIYLYEMRYLNENKKPEIVIRKLDKTEENIVGLDSQEEYIDALEKFVKKHGENIDIY